MLLDSTSAWPKKLGQIILVVFGTILVAVLLVTYGVVFYGAFKHKQPPAPVGLNVVATPAPEVKKQPQIDKPIKAKTVKVYPAAVKNTIKLPEIIQDNPALDVIASNQVPADDHPQTITTLINTDTGESQTFVKRDPLPWLALDPHGEAGLYMGIKNGEPTARLEVKQGAFQVKTLHFGVIGSVDQPISGVQGTDYFIGTGAWMRW
jgi:hypothetical protein